MGHSTDDQTGTGPQQGRGCWKREAGAAGGQKAVCTPCHTAHALQSTRSPPSVDFQSTAGRKLRASEQQEYKVRQGKFYADKYYKVKSERVTDQENIFDRMLKRDTPVPTSGFEQAPETRAGRKHAAL